MRNLSQCTHKRLHDIKFHKNGNIDICQSLSKLLDLRAGDVIDVVEDNEQLYIIKRYNGKAGRHRNMIHPTYGKTYGHCRVYSKEMCTNVLEVKNATQYISFFTSHEVVELYGYKAVSLIPLSWK
jgi:hypothetical protein|nr:MAG TPA_asm: Transition state regulatory protein abrB HOMODIMER BIOINFORMATICS [Caudoviricetes sp.]